MRPGEETVDGEVVEEAFEEAAFAGYGASTVNQVNAPPGVTVLGQGAPPQVDFGELAAEIAQDRRARAVALFVELPLLGFIALTDDMPSLVRLAALGLGAYKVIQLTQSQQAFDAVLSSQGV